jgi:hypothetical protein
MLKASCYVTANLGEMLCLVLRYAIHSISVRRGGGVRSMKQQTRQKLMRLRLSVVRVQIKGTTKRQGMASVSPHLAV